MRKRLSIPLALTAALLVYAVRSPSPAILPVEEIAAEPAIAPESYANTVVVQEYGVDGQPLDRTEAKALRRFSDSALVEMDAPVRWGHEGDGNWVAKADRGILRERSNVLELRDRVSLSYVAEGARFEAPVMWIRIDERAASSDQPVRAWQGDNELTGQQFRANLDKQVATLTGGVTGRYVPQN